MHFNSTTVSHNNLYKPTCKYTLIISLFPCCHYWRIMMAVGGGQLCDLTVGNMSNSVYNVQTSANADVRAASNR